VWDGGGERGCGGGVLCVVWGCVVRGGEEVWWGVWKGLGDRWVYLRGMFLGISLISNFNVWNWDWHWL